MSRKRETHAQAATRMLGAAETHMREAGFLRESTRLELCTDGTAYWVAYVSAPDLNRSTSVIGASPRDAARFAHGYLTAVCAITGQTRHGCRPD